MKRLVTILVLLMVLCTSCTKKKFDSYGLYLNYGNSYTQVPISQEYPSEAVTGDPILKIKSNIYLYYPLDSIEDLVLQNTDLGNKIDFSVNKTGNDLFEITVKEDLLNGSYCLNLGNTLSSNKDKIQWCFWVGSNSPQSNSSDETKLTYPKWLIGSWKSDSGYIFVFNKTGEFWSDHGPFGKYEQVSETTIKLEGEYNKEPFSEVWLITNKSDNHLGIEIEDSPNSFDRIELANVTSFEQLSNLFSIEGTNNEDFNVYFNDFAFFYNEDSSGNISVESYPCRIVYPGFLWLKSNVDDSYSSYFGIPITNIDEKGYTYFSWINEGVVTLNVITPNKNVRKDIIGIWTLKSSEALQLEEGTTQNSTGLKPFLLEPVFGDKIEFTKNGEIIFHNFSLIKKYSIPNNSLIELEESYTEYGSQYIIIKNSDNNSLDLIYDGVHYNYTKVK